MDTEHDRPSAAPKQFVPVRGLVIIGTIGVLLGVCSLLYASHSLTPEIYKLLAAALIFAGLGTFAKIPQQRRAIRQTETGVDHEQT
jgi:hypothetical protein